jgi:hypothetical protein
VCASARTHTHAQRTRDLFKVSGLLRSGLLRTGKLRSANVRRYTEIEFNNKNYHI